MLLSNWGMAALALECADGKGVLLWAMRLVDAVGSGRSLRGVMSGISVTIAFEIHTHAVRTRIMQQAGGDRAEDLPSLGCSSVVTDRSAPRRCDIVCGCCNI